MPIIALPCQPLSANNNFCLNWISQSCCVGFSKLLDGYDGLIYRFLWFVTGICQKCYMDFPKFFYVILSHCQTNPSWSLTKISKHIKASALNYRCEEWVKVVNALGPLCLWQCFIMSSSCCCMKFYNCFYLTLLASVGLGAIK